MRAIVVHTRRRNASDRNKRLEAKRFNFRNPPLLWRRVFVGTTLAMPGVVAGLLMGLMLPEALASYSSVLVSIVAFFVGFVWEGN